MASHGEDGSCSCCTRGGAVAVESLDEFEFGRSLSGAAHRGDVNKMKQLLEKGACVSGGPGAPYTPLHYAARGGHLEACRLLLKYGAEVDARTRSGKATSLHRAAYAGHDQIVKLLISKGADVGAADSDGQTPLDKALQQKHIKVIEMIQSFSLRPTPGA